MSHCLNLDTKKVVGTIEIDWLVNYLQENIKQNNKDADETWNNYLEQSHEHGEDSKEAISYLKEYKYFRGKVVGLRYLHDEIRELVIHKLMPITIG